MTETFNEFYTRCAKESEEKAVMCEASGEFVKAAQHKREAE